MKRPIRHAARAAMLGAAVLALSRIAVAQTSIDAGAAALALSGSITARSDARFARWNPAAARASEIVALSDARAAVDGLAGLFDTGLHVTLPYDSLTTVDAGAAGTGFGPYRLVTLSASASRSLGASFVAGAALRIEVQSIDGYGTAGAILLDVGVIAHVTPEIAAGLVARNVGGSSLRGIARPQPIGLGVAIPLADSAELSIDLAHDAGRGASIASGVTVRVTSELTLRAGAALIVPALSAGIGFDDGRTIVDVSAAWIDGVGVQCAAGAGLRW